MTDAEQEDEAMRCAAAWGHPWKAEFAAAFAAVPSPPPKPGILNELANS